MVHSMDVFKYDQKKERGEVKNLGQFWNKILE